MTKDELQSKVFMSDLKTRIMAVAFELVDDSQYTKLDAVNDLLRIVATVDESGRAEVAVPDKVSGEFALKITVNQV